MPYTLYDEDANSTTYITAVFCNKKLTVTEPEKDPIVFEDVIPGAYYADAVQWVVANGITNGYGSNTTFCPDVVCSRGQIVTFLYRGMN